MRLTKNFAVLFTFGAVLLSLLPATPAAAQCVGDVNADIIALDQVLIYNRLGAYAPTGMIFALARDVFPLVAFPGFDPNAGPFTLENSCAVQSCAAGAVQMRPDKRPRPLTLRVNEGDTICIEFTNLLATNAITDAMNEAPGVGVLGIQSEQPTTRHAGLHIHGLQWTSADGNDDGSYAGANLSSLAAPGDSTSYEYFAEKEGAYVITSGPNLGGEGGSGAIANGLFGVLNVEPAGAEWYRSQLTRVDMDLATPAEEFTDLDGDGIWDASLTDEYTDLNSNTEWDASLTDEFTDLNLNTVWDASLTDEFTDLNLNTVWDASLTDEFTDLNLNTVWDASLTDEFTDVSGDGVWQPGEPFINDWNGNGTFEANYPEPFINDWNGNGTFEASYPEPFTND